MKIKVWDLPLRLFHWLLVIAVGAAWLSAELGEDFGNNAMMLHGKIGIFIIGLLAFRLVWGFVGSTHARFRNFCPSPTHIRAYLAGQWSGLGHNPIGALSVFALLGLLTIQGISGLFANDDISFSGPLSSLVSAAVSERLTRLHHLSFNILSLLIGLHIAAILFYAHVKKINLVKPMITGETDAHETQPPLNSGGGKIALIFAIMFAAAVVVFASGQWIEKPQVTAPAAAW